MVDFRYDICHNVEKHPYMVVRGIDGTYIFSLCWCWSETSIEKTNVTENDCNLNTRQPRWKSPISEIWNGVECKREDTSKYIVNIFNCTQIYPTRTESRFGTKGIHQAGPTGTQNGKTEPCGNYRMHGTLAHCVHSSRALSRSLCSMQRHRLNYSVIHHVNLWGLD